MRAYLWAALPLTLVAAAAAHAATIIPTVTTSSGTTYNTALLTDFSTTTAEMLGSMVTVTFFGGSMNSAIWTAAGASNTGWSLFESGDTYSGPWTFTNTASAGGLAITSFAFDGAPGNTTFDISPSTIGSPGSSFGRSFSSVTGPAGLSVNALYTNQLNVGGVFYGDEYTKLITTFGGGGLTSGNSITFRADTDNASVRGGGITASVPEPATWAMMLVGFGAIGGAMRKSRQRQRMNYNFA